MSGYGVSSRKEALPRSKSFSGKGYTRKLLILTTKMKIFKGSQVAMISNTTNS
jgi:hypothetical protein